MRSNPPFARRDPRPGFTLIEMLVVIAIIVVLAGLALPAIMKARESSRTVGCLSNLRQLGIAINGYRDANGYYPPYRVEDPGYVNKFGVVRPRWQWLMSDFTGRPAQNPDVILAVGTSDTTYTNVPLDNEVFVCPSLATSDGGSIRNGSYGYNFRHGSLCWVTG